MPPATRPWPLVLLFALLVPASASAGAWTRDQGHFFTKLSYGRIRAVRFYGPYPDQPRMNVVAVAPYTQHQLDFYGEIGILSRWLTATVEATLLRHNSILDLGGGTSAAYGFGDARLGLWSGLVERPVRFSVAFLAGFPTGDPSPQPRPDLPTGDGEFDFELRSSLGYGFGGYRRWPLQHYVLAEAGLWLRTRSRVNLPDEPRWPDGFTYKLEFGLKFPWKVIDRFWFVGRLAGVEAFLPVPATRDNPAYIMELVNRCANAWGGVGLGPCVTYTAYGFEVAAAIWKGLGASFGLDSAFRARFVAAGANLRVGVSYEW